MSPVPITYAITLTVRHDFGAPSRHARTMVRVVPSDIPGRQSVGARILDVEPRPSERRDLRDFFGNAMTALVFHDPVTAIAVTLRARVDRHARPPSLDLTPGPERLATEIAADRRLSADAPAHFLGPSPRVRVSAPIAEFARGVVTPGMTALATVEALGRALHDTMRFDAGATDVSTTPDEAFAARHGVCQDFSHVMIAGLRALGIPAAYVSGFLRTVPPPGQARLAGADAMHAWVSAWCGAQAGWIDYDPTNRCRVAQDHVVVARGRDYGDVSPVRGSLRGAGRQTSHHAVDMEPLSPAGARNA